MMSNVTEESSNESSSLPKPGESVLKAIVQAFYESDKYKDITFIVAKTKIPANAIFVKFRSFVLKAMIEDPKRNEEDPITLDENDLEGFQRFIKFFYTNDCDLTIHNVLGMFLLSKKYDVPSLKKKCLDFLEKKLTRTNVASFAVQGVKNPELSEVFQKCLELFPNVFDRMSFYYADNYRRPTSVFPSSLVQKILEQCRDDFAEEAIFKKVYDWAKVYCKLNKLEIDSKNIKDAMKDLIPYIRFENLTPATLASIVRPNHLLDSEVLLRHFCKIALKDQQPENNANSA